ncbi:MAG: hypothetical protein KJ558_09235 [Gammaproteobacteria bacterium]|nr:hypothetical protein [Gammaproteobacteria bacterium]MBU1654991.1 hypothetical protein [Gammaproteobacteria bacterium]MBU1960012.1 hypothetical protein [Gammaproteobacteria bacterium]
MQKERPDPLCFYVEKLDDGWIVGIVAQHIFAGGFREVVQCEFVKRVFRGRIKAACGEAFNESITGNGQTPLGPSVYSTDPYLLNEAMIRRVDMQ